MSNQLFKSVRQSVNHWYLPVIAGVILVLISFWTFASPVAAFLTLALLFSISFISTGIFEILFSLSNRTKIDNWGWHLILGFITLFLGAMLLFQPLLSASTLALYVGFIVLFRSFNAIGMALDLKKYNEQHWGVLLFLGVLGVFLSFILIWNPVFAGLSIVVWIGFSLLTAGLFSLFLGVKMKGLHKNWDNVSAELKEKLNLLEEQINKELKQ